LQGFLKEIKESGGINMDGLDSTLEAMLAGIVDSFPKIIAALVVFFLSLLVAGLVARAVQRGMNKRGVEEHITLLLGKVVRWALIILGTALALEQVNFDLTTFLAGLGIVGFTVGFAIQDVSKNFIAGLLLLLQQPFDLGDTIKVGEFTGVVQLVDLRATELRTLDGLYVLIPNADVFTSPITNITRAAVRREAISVGVAYESDLAEVQRIALATIVGVDGFVADPKPRAVFDTFAPSTIDLTVYYWYDTKVSNPQMARDQGIALLKTAFDQAGIEMPFPTQMVLQPQ
jgi:small-conductance mechanosensitive channel